MIKKISKLDAIIILAHHIHADIILPFHIFLFFFFLQFSIFFFLFALIDHRTFCNVTIKWSCNNRFIVPHFSTFHIPIPLRYRPAGIQLDSIFIFYFYFSSSALIWNYWRTFAAKWRLFFLSSEQIKIKEELNAQHFIQL